MELFDRLGRVRVPDRMRAHSRPHARSCRKPARPVHHLGWRRLLGGPVVPVELLLEQGRRACRILRRISRLLERLLLVARRITRRPDLAWAGSELVLVADWHGLSHLSLLGVRQRWCGRVDQRCPLRHHATLAASHLRLQRRRRRGLILAAHGSGRDRIQVRGLRLIVVLLGLRWRLLLILRNLRLAVLRQIPLLAGPAAVGGSHASMVDHSRRFVEVAVGTCMVISVG